MAGHHDPKLLYAINGIKAYHIQDGETQPLTPSGPQTLSLLMVPTNSPFADLSTTRPQNEAPDEDFYLHLNLPPELDLPLPATTQIYHQPPTSYLIPRWDLGPGAHAFTKIEFPPIGQGVTQEDVDTFETILAQCTAFLERAKPPMPEKGEKGSLYYNPQDYAAGGRYSDGKETEGGHIVLVDEEDGSVVGELGGDAKIYEDSKLKIGSKDPVEVQVSQDGKRIEVRPISEDYLQMARHPAYKDSSLVQNAATASRLIVTSSSYIGNMLTSGAESFTQKTKPNQKPMEFSPAAHERVRRINTFTHKTANLSSKTVGRVTDIAQNAAAHMSGHKNDRARKGYDVKGNALSEEDYKPGFLNKSMIAFTTIADGIATSGKSLLTTSGAAASTVVGHKWGDQAGNMAADLAGGVKNVGLVYIDVAGVSRRAVIKSVAKGMVVGKVRGGGEVVVGGGDGGVVPEQDIQDYKEKGGPSGQFVDRDGYGSPQGGFAPQQGAYEPMGFGNSAPPRY
jgi:spartin